MIGLHCCWLGVVVSAQDNLAFSNFSASMTSMSVMPVASTAILEPDSADNDLELLGDGSDTAHASGPLSLQVFALCTLVATLMDSGSSQR